MPNNNGFSKKFAIRNVESVQLFDRVTGELFAECYNLKNAPINQTVDLNYATGGQGNARIAVFESNKNIEIPLQNALFDVVLIGEQAGSSAVEATNIVYDEIYTTDTADEATIDYALATDGDITVETVTAADDKTPLVRFTKVTTPAAADEYSITATTITFFASAVAIGSFVRVIQEVTTIQSIDVITSLANEFAEVYKAVIIAPVKDLYTDKEYIGQIIIPRAKLNDSFNLAFQNDGEVAVHDAMLSALADINSKKLWEMKIFDLTDLTA